jgi:hypothetical protein
LKNGFGSSVLFSHQPNAFLPHRFYSVIGHFFLLSIALIIAIEPAVEAKQSGDPF